MSLPLSHISWAITGKCNLNCKFCFCNNNNNDEISFLEAKEKIFSPLKQLGGKSIGFTGGEPLLREDIFDMIRYAKSLGFITSLVTNGMLVDENMALKLKNAGIDKIQISLDSAQKNKNDAIRGDGVFDQVTKHSIPLLVKKGFDITLVATPTSALINSFDEYVKLGEILNVSKIYIRRFVSNDVTPNIEYKSLYKKFLQETIQKKNDIINIKLFCGDPLIATLDPDINKFADDDSIIGGCSAGLNSLAIDEKGDIKACTRLPVILGNIRINDLQNIWLNNDVLANLRNRDKLEGKCKTCSFKWICGGCRAAATIKNGSYLAEDPDCFH